MTKNEFDLKYCGKNVAVHCDTEQKARGFLTLSDSVGYDKWIGDAALAETDTMWRFYENDTCYRIQHSKLIVFSNVAFYKSAGFTIVEFDLNDIPTPPVLKEITVEELARMGYVLKK